LGKQVEEISVPKKTSALPARAFSSASSPRLPVPLTA